jgi:ABC-type transporter Mla subunit MlaD
MEAIIGEIQSLINQVAGLPLNAGQINSLTVKLENAINQLSKDPPRVNAACGLLKAFINEVEAFIQANKLTEAEGQPLIDQATDIRTQLNCHQGEK